MTNLLLNGDFTDEGWSHDALICKPGEDPLPAEIGNIFSPADWVTWFRHEPGVWDQPEVRDARSEDRLYDGHKAVLYFTFYRKHWGGLMQQVPVEAGRRYRLAAWAHDWSNSQNGPHVDDPKWSEGPGYGAGYLSPPLAEGATPPAGSPGTTDDWRNFAFNVGLDPNGGVNPFNASIRWGTGASIYNVYDQVPAVEVEATGPVMTVWLRSRTLWPFKHNDAYWGAALLEEVEEEPEPPEPELRQYERTAVLFGPDTTKEKAHALLDEYWQQRRSFLFSADDAMAASTGVTSRTVICYDADSWTGGRDGLIAFRDTYYPGVVLEFPENPSEPAVSELRLAYPTTKLPPVVTSRFGDTAGRTVAHCGLDLRSSWAVWQDRVLCALPGEVIVSGDVGGGFGVQVRTQTELADGRIVYVRYAHLVSSKERAQVGDVLAVGDVVGYPNSGGVSTADHLHIDVAIDGLRNYVDPEPLIDWPEDEEELPAADFNPRVLTLHLQQDVEAAQRFVTTCKPAGIKRVLGAQNLPTYAVLNPGMRCVYRGMAEHEDPTTFINMHIDTLHQVADMFEARGLPLIDGHYFWFELWNEVYGFDREPNIMWRDRELAAVRYLAELEPRVGAVAFNAGVGNIHPPNFDVLVPLAQAIQDTGGMFGLHSYFGVTPTRCTMDNYQDEGRWLESRFEMTDDYLTARGIRVNWFLSEGGAIYYQPPTNMPYSSDGWRHPNCLNGNWLQYLARLEQLAQHLYQWNETHGGRCKGYSLFTSGSFNSWRYFELGSAEIDAIAVMQVRLWPL